MKSTKRMSTETLTLGAILTAIVAVLQLLGSVTTFFGPFSTAVALVPIVIGAAMCGPTVGAWLGLVFGIVVLLSGGAALFLPFSVHGTLITVLAKGTVCGLAAGLVYKLLEKTNVYLAVIVAALSCPIVNTGLFLLGSRLFFMDFATEMATMLGMNISGMAFFWALAMGNFILEVLTSVILAPVIVRLLRIKKKA